jgi:tetratricopeptide (TPR) repeat protein
LLLAVQIAWSQASASIATAEALIASGRLDQGLQQLSAVQNDQKGRVEHVRGMAFYLKGELNKAATAFADAVAKDPKNLDAVEMEGVSLFRLGRSGEAIPLLEKAHITVPEANIDPQYVLGLCYMDSDRYDDARKAFASQYGFPPESAEAYLLEGRMLLRRNLLPAAVDAAHKALMLRSSLPQAHLVLGQIALAQGNTSAAITEFERERELNPLDGAPYERLGDAYIRSGQFELAQQALNRAVLLEPNVSVPYLLLGKALLKQQNPFMAKLYLERALQMDPRNYMAHFLLGKTYRSLGQNADATREYDAAVKIQTASAPKIESPE